MQSSREMPWLSNAIIREVVSKDLHINRIIRGGILSPLLLFFTLSGLAQTNITGKPGLIYTPTARYTEDGNFAVGLNFVPKDYGFERNINNPGRILFVNLTVLSRLDVNVNMLQLFSTPDHHVKLGLGDRQLDFRYLILKEKTKQPSLAIIVSNPMSVSPTVLTHALVATKNIKLNGTVNAEISLGYGSPYHSYRKGSTLNNYGLFENIVIEKKSKYRRHKHYLEGPFGGVAFRFKQKYGLMLEYDSRNVNVGAYAVVAKKWTLQAGVLNLQQITFGTAYNFSLLKLPKRITRLNEQ